MKKVFALILMVMSLNAHSENWIDFDNKTYLGGYYFIVCEACLDGRYHNDNSGYWACTDSNKPYEKGCAKGILDAIMNRPTAD